MHWVMQSVESSCGAWLLKLQLPRSREVIVAHMFMTSEAEISTFNCGVINQSANEICSAGRVTVRNHLWLRYVTYVQESRKCDVALTHNKNVSHFQLPVTVNSDSPADLYLCLCQSAGSQPARQEQNRDSRNFLEVCSNR